MENREQLPDLGWEEELDRGDLRTFKDEIVWPAINDLYGSDFRATSYAGQGWEEPQSELDDAVTGEVNVKLRLEADHMITNGMGEDMEGPREWFRASFSLLTRFDLPFDDAVELQEGTTVWEVKEFIFLQSYDPFVHIYYEFHDVDGEELDQEEDMSVQEAQLFEEMKDFESNYTITRGECAEVYCGLLTMGADEGAMSYDQWVNNLRFI